MENNKKTSLSELMETSMGKVREMVDSNTIIGQPITTPDGVTLIPVSRMSFGFGCGGGDYGSATVLKNLDLGTPDGDNDPLRGCRKGVRSFAFCRK